MLVMGICESGFEILDENGIVFFWMAGVCVMLKLCHVEQSFPHTYIYYKVCTGDGVSGRNCRAGWATGWMGVEQDVFLIII